MSAGLAKGGLWVTSYRRAVMVELSLHLPSSTVCIIFVHSLSQEDEGVSDPTRPTLNCAEGRFTSDYMLSVV